jgi:predicted DsbA family dithiol-disulfide isomerase
MHDKLLEHQDALTPLDLGRYATEVGLDVERFWDDIHHRRRRADRIAEDVGSADASGVAGTPSFFIKRQALRGHVRHRHADRRRACGPAPVAARRVREPAGSA